MTLSPWLNNLAQTNKTKVKWSLKYQQSIIKQTILTTQFK